MNQQQSFDLRTHIRDPKNGRIVKAQPYRLHCSGSQRVFERDGKKFLENGEPFVEHVEPVKEAKVEPKPQSQGQRV